MVYGLRSVGNVVKSGKILCAILDIPKPLPRFGVYNSVIEAVYKCEQSTFEAVEEAVSKNDGSSRIDCLL